MVFHNGVLELSGDFGDLKEKLDQVLVMLREQLNHQPDYSQSIDLLTFNQILGNISAYQWGRRLALTAEGNPASIPWRAKPGDVVVVFLGARLPHILRPLHDGYFEFLGDAYVYGLMGGEILKMGLETKIVKMR